MLEGVKPFGITIYILSLLGIEPRIPRLQNGCNACYAIMTDHYSSRVFKTRLRRAVRALLRVL